MLTLLMYAVCAIVFFQGVAIFQRMVIAAEPTSNWRRWSIWIGAIGFVMATFVAVGLACQFTLQAGQAIRALEPMINR